MFKRQWLKFLSILLIPAFLTGCALALADKALGDKKATHEDDQTVSPSDNGGYIN